VTGALACSPSAEEPGSRGAEAEAAVELPPAPEPEAEEEEAEELEPARETVVVWADMVTGWQAIDALGQQELDSPTMLEIADRTQKLGGLLEELGRSIGDDLSDKTRLEVKRGSRLLQIEMLQLYQKAMAQIPGIMPGSLDRVGRWMYTMQQVFPEGYLQEPLLSDPAPASADASSPG
jgi:hypothetical protein